MYRAVYYYITSILQQKRTLYLQCWTLDLQYLNLHIQRLISRVLHLMQCWSLHPKLYFISPELNFRSSVEDFKSPVLDFQNSKYLPQQGTIHYKRFIINNAKRSYEASPSISLKLSVFVRGQKKHIMMEDLRTLSSLNIPLSFNCM